MPRIPRQLSGVAPRVLMLGLVVLILFHWKIGPVVLTLTASHGVHAGDALAAVPALVALLPGQRTRLERRQGIVSPISPNPGRRASDREPPGGPPA